MLLCTKCGNKFSDKLIRVTNNGKMVCPVINCGENLIEVDHNLVETILLLNKKGWKTKFCALSKPDMEREFVCHIIFDKESIENIADGKSVFTSIDLPDNARFELQYQKMRMSKDKEEDNKYLFPTIRIKLTNKIFDLSTIEEDELVTCKMNLIKTVINDLYKWTKKLPKYESLVKRGDESEISSN